MSAVAAPADRRFRRAHVKPARRRPWRARLLAAVKLALAVAVAAYAIYRGEAFVAHARVLQIDRILVSGNERLSTEEVLAVLEPMRGEHLIWSDLRSWRARLLESSWLRDASLHRILPSTIQVEVTERTPIGIARLNGMLYLVDEHGVVIDDYGPSYADFDLPIIDGLSIETRDRRQADATRLALATKVIDAVRGNAEVARRLSQIDVGNLHNAAVTLSGDPGLVYIGEDRFLQRLQLYLDLAPTLRERVSDIDYVDVRIEDRISVRAAERGRRPVASR